MLAAAILLLALPLLVADRLRRLSWFEAALAWVVRVTLVGLFFGFILPDAWEHAGAWSLLTAALGALVPTLAERAGLAEGRVEGVNLLVGQAGLLLHAGFDGMAIATSPGFSAMAVSVLVHQLPVGFAVVGMQPRGALLGVLAMSIATTVGYLVGHEWLAGMAVLPLGLFQAFAGGSLLHFVGHRHAPAA